MFNDLFELLADVPPMLVAAWVAWLGTGALIVMWFRRVQYEDSMPAPAPRPASRPKTAPRPAVNADPQAIETPADTPVAAEPYAPALGVERTRPPVTIGDPFGDLAKLLDPPGAAVATEFTPPPAEPRAPADSPILSSSGSPIRRSSPNEPGH